MCSAHRGLCSESTTRAADALLQGLEAVYTGGRSASELENSVERALTRRDTMGRVLTPKEAFRDLCHQCACFSCTFRLAFSFLPCPTPGGRVLTPKEAF